MTPPTIKRRKANAPAYPYDHRVQPKARKAVAAMVAHVQKLMANDPHVKMNKRPSETYAEYIARRYAGVKQLEIKTMRKK